MVNIFTEERYLTGGKPDVAKVGPFLLTMPDNRYRAVGENAGRAWSAGKSLMGSLRTAGGA